jgi:hypothetical protein
VIRSDIVPHPGASRRPLESRVLPERICGRQAERQQRSGAKIEAARRDIKFRYSGLVTAEADPQPSILVMCRELAAIILRVSRKSRLNDPEQAD